MRLSRQLFIIITVLFLLVFIGTLYSNIVNARNYLNKNLEFHAQDTATSLGLSLTHAVAVNDLAVVNSMVDAIYDRGYFQTITIKDSSGKVMVNRDTKVWIKDVPGWFIDMVPLQTPVKESTVMQGWNQVATVYIKSHPGYAYREIWNTTIQTAIWLLISGVVAFFLVAIVLRLILSPLQTVEQQAIAIAAREFKIVDKLPWTRELRHVVSTMNSMATKIRDMLDAQTALTEKMRSLAYEDEVTSLRNRRSFDERMQHISTNPDEFSFGALFLVQINGFKEFNDSAGYEAGDELLWNCAGMINQAVGDDDRYLLARLSGADFALLGRNITPQQAGELAENILNRTRQVIPEACGMNIGIAYLDPGQPVARLLPQADTALRAAQKKGTDNWELQKIEDEGTAFGAQRWRDALQEVIHNKAVLLYQQPVYACAGGVLHHVELLPRIRTSASEELVSAGIFIPVAEHHGMVHDIDKLVVEAALHHVRASANQQLLYAINLSPASILDSGFVDWLCQTLSSNKAEAGRLIVETSEQGTVSYLAALTEAVNRIKQAGSHFSIDHFGASTASFGYIKSLRVDYIKIDGGYIHHLQDNEDSQFFIRSLSEIAHGLDIQIIAEFVETKEELTVLQTLNIDAAQGYLLGQPAEASPPAKYECE
jgi:diguanylate cyclase (GGDEF)-like protein